MMGRIDHRSLIMLFIDIEMKEAVTMKVVNDLLQQDMIFCWSEFSDISSTNNPCYS